MSQKTNKKRISIKNSMILRMVSLIIIVSLIIVFLEVGYSYNNSKTQMEHNMENTATLIISNFFNVINENEKILNGLADMDGTLDLMKNENFLQKFCNNVGWTELGIKDETSSEGGKDNRTANGNSMFTLKIVNSNGSKQFMLSRQISLNGETNGILYCIFSSEFMDTIINDTNIGKKGKIYILDNGENIIFERESSNQNSLTKESNEEELKLVYDDYRKMILDGEKGYENYSGKEGNKYIYYAPLEINDWGIIVEEDIMECSGFNLHIFMMRIVFILIVILVSVVFIYKSLDGVMKPINKCIDRLKKMMAGDLSTAVEIDERFYETKELTITLDQFIQSLSKMIVETKEVLGSLAEGNLDVKPKDVFTGEFKQLEVAIEHIINEFNDMLAQLSDAAYEVTKGSEQVSQSSLFLSDGSSEQMTMVQKSYSSLNKIIENLTGIVRIKNETYDMEKADENPIKMENLTKAMGRIANSSEQIQKIVKTIAGISSQTKMLSINASVEAARAGAAGKGFSVVVEEIRELASKSRDATNDTKKLILNVISSVENGSNTVSDTVESVEQIAVLINDFRDLLIKISNNTENTAAISEESAAASEQLNEQANHLQDMVNKFTLRKEKGVIG